jgi:hypothetical protein
VVLDITELSGLGSDHQALLADLAVRSAAGTAAGR